MINSPLRTALLICMVLVHLTGCESIPFLGGGPKSPPVDPELISRMEALNAEVDQLNIEIRDAINKAADEVYRNARTADQRRNAQLWKERLNSRYDRIFAPVDAGKELPEAWLLSQRVIEYLTTGEGRTLFGDKQPEAIATSREIQQKIELLMDTHADQQEVQELRTQLAAVAKRHPLTGLFEGEETPKLLERTGTTSRMATLGTIGRSPFTALRGVASGVGTVGGAVGGGVTGIAGLQDPISNFTNTLGKLPETTRMETEILYRTVETSDMATSAMMNVSSFARTGERFASVAETLPEDLRTNIIQALEESKQSQEEARNTMQEATRLMQSVTATLAEGDTLAETIKGVVQETNLLSENVMQLQEASKPPPGTPPKEPGRPFDIIEYQQTIIALTETVRELRGTVEQVHQFVQDDSLQKTAEVASAEAARVIDSAVRDSERLVDKIFIRVAALLVLFFFLLTAYQLLKRRLSTAPTQTT